MNAVVVPEGVKKNGKRFVGENGGELFAQRHKKGSLVPAGPGDFQNGTRFFEMIRGPDGKLKSEGPMVIAIQHDAMLGNFRVLERVREAPRVPDSDWGQLQPLAENHNGNRTNRTDAQKSEEKKPRDSVIAGTAKLSSAELFAMRTAEAVFGKPPPAPKRYDGWDPLEGGV